MPLPRLFHVSEEKDISIFSPRPSPSHFNALKGDCVFAIEERLLHNYLLPRDCPRVCFYANEQTSAQDHKRFMAGTRAEYVVAVESRWLETILSTELYLYEFPSATFELLDAVAGYHISYSAVEPIHTLRIRNLLQELAQRGVEVRIMPSLRELAQAVAASTLAFSCIRMRNAV